MAYNNGFPMGYSYLQQPMFVPQQPQMQQPQQQQQVPSVGNEFIWVSSRADAESFLVAPNSSVYLMDSKAPVFYIKSADASGVPHKLRIFDYKERVESSVPEQPQSSKKLDEIESMMDLFLQRIDDLEKQIANNDTSTKKGAKT